MPQVQITDDVFKAHEQRAADGGYSSVDEYVSEVVVHDLRDDAESFDHRFTPERLAELDRISAEIDAGEKTYTITEVQEQLALKRKAWLANHAVRRNLCHVTARTYQSQFYA